MKNKKMRSRLTNRLRRVPYDIMFSQKYEKIIRDCFTDKCTIHAPWLSDEEAVEKEVRHHATLGGMGYYYPISVYGEYDQKIWLRENKLVLKQAAVVQPG